MRYYSRRSLHSTLWVGPVFGILLYILLARYAGVPPAVPFLLLYAGVAAASFGGAVAGAIAGLIVSGFVVYSTMVSFGPSSLTGGAVQAFLGCALYLLTGILLGRVRDENRRLVDVLTAARNDLEETVRERTHTLENTNADLRREIEMRQAIARELEDSEVRVQHSQRLESIGVLAGGIAHDFNNLLTSIRANSNILHDEKIGEHALELVGEIESASDRATALCKQMLTYAGEHQGSRGRVDFRETLEETIGFLRASVPKKIRFEVECHRDICVIADPALIGQVMLNLLTNAAEAIADVGTVRTTLDVAYLSANELPDFLLSEELEPGSYVRIVVEDDGAGMSKAQADRVFDPFYSTKFAGRGLGLAVVFGAARAHQGAVQLRSEEGIGTKISFVVPYAPPGGEAVASEPKEVVREATPEPPGQTRERAGTILIVDDEVSIRRVAIRILTSAGWRILEAGTGTEAVECLRNHPEVVLVLLDLTMPEMDGREALNAIKSMDPDLPVILMSGYDEEVSKKTAANTFLCKPFGSKQLALLVDEYAR